MHDPDQLDSYLSFAEQLALAAGEMILSQSSSFDTAQAKADGSLVTTVDSSVDRHVVHAIKRAYPQHQIVSEESGFHLGSHPSKNMYSWICDPLDGTLPYTLGIPISVFSIALVDGDGHPLVAAIYDPFSRRMFTAKRGGGAYANGMKISVNDVERLSNAVVGFSGTRSNILAVAEAKGAVIDRCYRMLILSCVLYEATLVATGKIAATMFPGSTAHDVASAKLIVEEAGGVVSNIVGQPQRYDQAISGAVMSNGRVHREIVDTLRPYVERS